MGEVEYERRIYKTEDNDGKNMHVYLLDQYLKRETNSKKREMKMAKFYEGWEKRGICEEGVHYQLDPFHRARAVVRAVPEKAQVKKLNNMFDDGKIDEGMEYLTELMIEYVEDEKVKERLYKLYNYLANNYDGLMPYKLRDISLPNP